MLGEALARMRDFAGGLESISIYKTDKRQPRIVIQESDRTVVIGPHPEVEAGWVFLAYYPNEHLVHYLSQGSTWKVLELKGSCCSLDSVLRAFLNGMTKEQLPQDMTIMPIQTID